MDDFDDFVGFFIFFFGVKSDETTAMYIYIYYT